MSENTITKVILPIAGLGTRFLPLSLALSKEFFPLVDKPIIQHIIEEVKQAGIREVVFVISSKQKMILNYFKKSPELEAVLTRRKKESALQDLRQFEDLFSDITFSFVTQKQPMGDGDAIFQGSKNTGKEAVAVSFCDDVVYAEIPALGQLMNIFSTSGSPVIALKSVPKDRVSAYGSVAVEKIADRLYKIKKIVEKPAPGEEPSNLVIVGKYILTPDVFDYLKVAEASPHGEIVLANVLDQMLSEGKTIYGYELKGEWLECGDKLKWLKSFFYLSLKDPLFGKDLKEYLKTIK